MEQIGRSYGYIFYRTRLRGSVKGDLALDPVHHYAPACLHGKRVGTLDRHFHQTTVKLDHSSSGVLEIPIENRGRLNSTKAMRAEWRGLTLDVPPHSYEDAPERAEGESRRMIRLAHRLRQLAAVSVLSLGAALSLAQSSAAPTLAQLRADFLNPPADVRPMVRWWWFGAAVTRPEILRELQQMKADGIGGVELAFVYPEVVDGLNPRGLGTGNGSISFKNLPFLSPAMLDAVHYAETEGRRLGLRIDVTLCSGWPYGGPDTPLSEAAARLVTAEIAVPPNAKSTPLPKFAAGDSLISAAIAPGQPKHWTSASAVPLPLQIPTDTTEIDVAPSEKPRVAIFFIASHTRQQVKRAAVGAEGYVLDPFSHQAVAAHLAKVGEPLLHAFGNTPPYAIFSDSLEAYGADWTSDLPHQFLKRRGYDLLPHLPELIAGGTPDAERVRHDWGRTLTELVNENYLTQINDWAKAHGTKFRSQTYGEPAVSFSSEPLAVLPEGEGSQWRAFSTLRWASSANHVFGNNVTSGETFTWLHSPVFRATPLDMKAEADVDFISGENQLIFHGWPYSPPSSELIPGDPGWSLYAAGALNDHNPWHPVMPAVTSYIARISDLLRQGQPANQVALLLPTDDAWAGFSPGHVTVTGAMQKLIPPELMAAILSAGYNIDFIDADAINRVGLGTHQILVIPPTDRIPVETLSRLHPWYRVEGQVICYRRCPSIDPEGKPLPGMTGSLIVADNEAALVQDLKDVAKPDLQLGSPTSGVGFIRRKLPDADIYFVVNTSNQPIDTIASFSTDTKFGEQWDPETEAVSAANLTSQPLHLAPYESRVFVFTNGRSSGKLTNVVSPNSQLVDLSSDWHTNFVSANRSTEEHNLTDWTTNPATLHYSGEAIYSRDFMLSAAPRSPVSLQIDGGTAVAGAPSSPPEHGPLPAVIGPNGLPNPLVTRPGPGMHAWFDPPIREAALVFVNGNAAGALWHPPYRLDVTKLLQQGTNHIEIHVYNTALNAWSALPPRDYQPLIAKYGDRFQMQDLNKVKPVPSGILGTIKLVTESAP